MNLNYTLVTHTEQSVFSEHVVMQYIGTS